MMLFKLSLRNIKKSLQNYVIYFATLIIAVSIFYVFNAISDQTVMLNIEESTREIVVLMLDALSVVSVFVSVVFAFLLVYANSFMMKRRKKEFGTYMILGMKKSKIAAIMVIETIIIGVISLVVGLLIGVVISQGMSVVVANMFETDMTEFKFIVSNESIVKTIMYFAGMFVAVIILNVFLVSKTKLISLLNAGKVSERNHAKNKFVCVVVFIIAVYLLATAYYSVTTEFNNIASLKDIGIAIIKGIVGTFMVFWSVSGMLLALVQKNKRFYYKKINCFSVRELSSRINTTVFSGSVICLLLFFTICILSTSVSIRKSINETLKKNTPLDYNIIFDYNSEIYDDEDNVIDVITDIDPLYAERKVIESGFVPEKVSDYRYINVYFNRSYIINKDLYGDNVNKLKYMYSEQYLDYYLNQSAKIIKLSDYNKFAELNGNNKIELADDEYTVLSDVEVCEKAINANFEEGYIITIGDKQYKPKGKKCIEGLLEMSQNSSNNAILIIPDSEIFDELSIKSSIIAGNFNDMSKEEKKQLEKFINGEEFEQELKKDENGEILYAYAATKQAIKDAAMGLSAMIIFLGMYLGVVFLISGAAVLSLKELSQAVDNKDKYVALRRIGVDNKMINRSLLAQSGFYFGLPLGLAIIHSIFGIQTGQLILAFYGNDGLLASILITALIIVGIYGLYFLITYFLSRKIINE